MGRSFLETHLHHVLGTPALIIHPLPRLVCLSARPRWTDWPRLRPGPRAPDGLQSVSTTDIEHLCLGLGGIPINGIITEKNYTRWPDTEREKRGHPAVSPASYLTSQPQREGWYEIYHKESVPKVQGKESHLLAHLFSWSNMCLGKKWEQWRMTRKPCPQIKQSTFPWVLLSSLCFRGW